jgi:DNA-binding XRE family transcriptional regulator
MQLRPEDYLSIVPALPRSRKDDAIRRLFSPRPSPEAKAAIAKRFKGFRRKFGVTQALLGDSIGICRQSINEIENRRVYPHYTTIARFADLEERHREARRITASLRKPFWR